MTNCTPLAILPQPNDASCGPTCLQAVYAYYGHALSLDRVIAEVESLESGGTLAVNLARHALRQGFDATIYTYNLEVFDPTWFAEPGIDLAERLAAQAEAKESVKLREATNSYLDFLSQGGVLRYRELTPQLIRWHLNHRRPILTGLSATYLYGCSREAAAGARLVNDDVRGVAQGHFVVLRGYDSDSRSVLVADPLHDNPRFESPYYQVGVHRVIGAILLGVLTYDANLLILTPPSAD